MHGYECARTKSYPNTLRRSTLHMAIVRRRREESTAAPRALCGAHTCDARTLSIGTMEQHPYLVAPAPCADSQQLVEAHSLRLKPTSLQLQGPPMPDLI